MMKGRLSKLAAAAVLVLAALISFTFLADRFSSPEAYEELSQSIDEKISTVGKLTGAATVASVAVSALPDDTATPLAERLAEITEYFLAVLCVLYAEKYLLTLIGALTFRVLIPIICLLVLLFIVFDREGLARAGVRLALFTAVITVAIPLSIIASDAIYDTYMPSINAAVSSAQSLSEDAESITGEDETADEAGGIVSRLINGVSQKVSELVQRASDILGSFLRVIAIMLVTSCIIPVLTLLFCLWLIKLVTGAETDGRKERVRRRRGESTVR